MPAEGLEVGVAVSDLDAADDMRDGDADDRGAIAGEDGGKGGVRETCVGVAEHDGIAGAVERSAVRDDRHNAGRGGGFRHVERVVTAAEVEVELLDAVEFDQYLAAQLVDEQERCIAAIGK